MNNNENTSFIQIADRLVKETGNLSKYAKSEEDLRIGFEKLLTPLLNELGVKSEPKYERLGADAAVAYKGRPDAVHGLVIIEYEKPGAFESPKWIEHAHQQLVNYIIAEATSSKKTLFVEDPKYVGIGFDGSQIFFTKYKGDKSTLKSEIDASDFSYDGPFSLDIESARTFLTYLRSLSRKPLTAEHLADAFGPQGTLAPLAISALADSLEHWGKERVRVFFNEWKRLFGIVYGEQFNASKKEEASVLEKLYKVEHETDFQELLFTVHTYFALLMKLIIVELLTLKETAFTSSYSHKLTHLSKEELISELHDIEDGGVYSKRGIRNFLEGDFFKWYLDAWSPRLEEAIRETTRRLSEFEPATSIINPETTRDLLKKLYQYLVPQEVRHKLGEYYTPDWLAELILDEVGYKGDSYKRFLDPACGSGTFLVLAIKRIKEFSKTQGQKPLETAKRIVSHVWGFDLNPLAIIAARTNYLFALGDLVEKLADIEIPVYLADSVLWPQRQGQLEMHFTHGDHIDVQTSVGMFHVPKIWVDQKGFLMGTAAPMVEEMVKTGYEPSEAMKTFKKHGLVFPPHEDVIDVFYKEILELEKQHKNGIWARFLKNAFAPMVAEKFDFVVGNPPWIMWQYLSTEYRTATQPLWENYGLTRIGKARNVLVRGRRDFSMLFTYASADYYLREGGKLGFLITQEVFKMKGGGEGFRRFQLGDGMHLRIIKAHDLVALQPFENATNKTAAIILQKGEHTVYPVPYIIWTKKNDGKILTDNLLKEVTHLLSSKKYLASPIGTSTGAWQTQAVDLIKDGKIEGKNKYRAHAGAYISPYGVFWLIVKQVLSDKNLLVENFTEKIKTQVHKIEATLEQDLVYPAIRGSDIKRWYVTSEINVLITHPASQVPYSEEEMKRKWPRIYNYLTNFRELLLKRSLYKHFHEKSGNPFYGQRLFGDYTFSNYKVVWKRMTNDLIAAVVSQHKTAFGYKILIPLETVTFFSTNDKNEAHYLCAIVNSKPVRDFIKSFSSAGRGFGSPSVMEHVGIPGFDSKNHFHTELAVLSEKLHELKTSGKEDEILTQEKKVDESVNKLFGITT